MREINKTLNNATCFIFALMFSSILVGCDAEGPAEKAGRKVDEAFSKAGDSLDQAKHSIDTKSEKSEVYVDDSLITAKIKADILADPLLKSSQINVTTANGLVYLSGTVDSPQSISRVIEIVRSHPQVKSIDNKLIAASR